MEDYNGMSMMEEFCIFLKQENKRLQEKIDSNNELIEFMEAGGYVEWNHQETVKTKQEHDPYTPNRDSEYIAFH